ncbi:MAG: hypothetical protein JNL82_26035 [Myxococcales bacterium]|nr:hypothetical protein [Myxococcales bacterium]
MRTVLLASILSLALLPRAADAEAPARPEAADKNAARDRILGALELPRKAQALRKAGLDDAAVKAGLKAARDKKLHAREAADLLDAAAQAVKDHGPVDNFGAFVQSQLDSGKRGKDLAEAIRAEHLARGKGHDGKGKPDTKGHDDKGHDAADHDSKGNDSKGNDAKANDNKGADAAGPDAKGHDTKANDSKGVDAAGPDAKGKSADAAGPDAKAKPADAATPDTKGKSADKPGPDDKGKSAKPDK